MSLILEALKKSEARRRLGEAPDLGTPFTPVSRRRSALPLILIAIVLAGFGGWYVYSSRAPSAPATTAQDNTLVATRQPVTSNPRPASAQTSPGPTSGGANLGHPATPPLSSRIPAPHRALPEPPIAFASDVAATGAKTAAVTKPAPSVAANAQTTTRPPAAVPAQTVTLGGLPHPAYAPAQEQPRADAQPTPPAVDVANDKTQQNIPASPATTESLPLYYELPLNVRKDLPTIALNMHVYAADPKQRFAVVNGDRKVEGDTIKDNLFLREIRPDGLVLEFHGQRFLLPRTGR